MAGGQMAMAEPNFGPIGDEPVDDLPRTFRREKEAREREARERAQRERAERVTAQPTLSAQPDVYVEQGPGPGQMVADMPFPASVRRFDVPFLHLVTFFLKAVLAAIPALILLTAILWFAGHLAEWLVPSLIKMKIQISFPGA
jgi:hypothetical protein